MEMDLDPTTDDAEMRLQDHNDIEVARCFILDSIIDATVYVDAMGDGYPPGPLEGKKA
jgi:hypothetical protein